ncbi:MAG TPA: hypothetical protein VGJ37_15810 [Pyrinomonadaceae bacterium]
MKGTPDVPFYKTNTFFICLAVLVVLVILFVLVLPKTNAQRGEPTRRPLVELALDKSKEGQLREALKWDFAFIPIYTFGINQPALFHRCATRRRIFTLHLVGHRSRICRRAGRRLREPHAAARHRDFPKRHLGQYRARA